VADVTAAGAEHDGCAVRFVGRREEYFEFLRAVFGLAAADGRFASGPKRDAMSGSWLGDWGCGLREQTWGDSKEGDESESGCSFHDVGF
jgi:hypothetical protein